MENNGLYLGVSLLGGRIEIVVLPVVFHQNHKTLKHTHTHMSEASLQQKFSEGWFPVGFHLPTESTKTGAQKDVPI